MDKIRIAAVAGLVAALAAVSPARAATDSVPVSAVLRLDAPQYQQTSYWCASASAAIVLAQQGVRIDQSVLAADFHTVTDVGVESDVRPVLDSLAAPGYRFQYRPDTTSPRILLSVVSYDIGVLRQPVMVALDAAKLPWNSMLAGHGPLWHVEVVYGYDENAGTALVWEVWGPTGGNHTIALSQLAAALNPSVGAVEVTRS